MHHHIPTRDVAAVRRAIGWIYESMFPEGDRSFVDRIFSWTEAAFAGHYKDYQAIDARYHDLEHTLQGALCMAELLQGRERAGTLPRLPRRLVELDLVAILLHDTGYLKKQSDQDGSGAKYTLTHVHRSVEFAGELLREKGFPAHEIKTVQNLIRCTGVNADLSAIPFQTEVEKIAGYALGTADLIGQMAAPDYVEKLPVLYEEFAESARFSGTPGMFKSAEDLIAKTPIFWEKYVVPKVEKDFEGLHEFLADPFPEGPNYYLLRIEDNLRRLSKSGKT